MKRKLLIVEDNEEYLNSLYNLFKDEFQVIKFNSFNEALTKISSDLSLALLDIRLNNNDPHNRDGIELLKQIKEEHPSVPVIMITAYGDIDVAVQAMKLGASDFIQKDKVSMADIKKLVKNTIEKTTLEKRVKILEKEICKLEPVEIIGKDEKIIEIKRIIKTIANDGKITVLIKGETGTGKELVARAIHSQGIRKNGPFVAVALSALSKDTLVSELFGHEKGAFTGAISKRIGYIEEANGGVLFLDEIGDLDRDIQLKLLRTIEERKVIRMGSTKPVNVDIQLIVATNKNLEQAVEDGSFRKDLYFRLKGIEISLPPLRERKEDIPLLSRHFLNLLVKQGRTAIREFSDEAMKLLIDYSWPGNVRELKQTIESAALRARLDNQNIILPEHLPIELKRGISPLEEKRELYISEKGIKLEEEMAKLELSYIEKTLRMCNGKKNKAWKLLGYNDRFAMRRRIKRIQNKYPELWNKFNYLREKYEHN